MRKAIIISFLALCLQANAQSDLLDNIKAYYKLNESNGSTANDELNAYDGTINGATVNCTGKMGTCYRFDGGSDDFEITPIEFSTTDRWTVAYWALDTSTSKTYETVIGIRTASYPFISHSNTVGILYFRNSYGDIYSFDVGEDYKNAWHHYVWTGNGSSVSLYYDGTFISSQSTQSEFTVTGIGNGYSNNTLCYGGYLDEIGIWDTNLTSVLIDSLYNNDVGKTFPFSTQVSCIMSQYLFENNWTDEAGNYDLTNVNSAFGSSTPDPLQGTYYADFDNQLYNRAKTQVPVNLASGPFTITFNIYNPGTASGTGYIFSNWRDGYGLIISIDHDNNRIRVMKYVNNSYELITSSVGTIPDATWTNVALRTYGLEGQYATLFINGELASNDTVLISGAGLNDTLYFGARYNGSYDLNCYLDNVQLYKIALSNYQIDLLYENMATGSYTVCGNESASGWLAKTGSTLWYATTGSTNWYVKYSNPDTLEYDTYYYWDWESESLGSYDEADAASDFDVQHAWLHNSGSIAPDTINGVETKVLKITHLANQLTYGFDLSAILDPGWDEIYLSYNLKFDNEFASTAGGKIPGLAGLPDTYIADNCDTYDSEDGFTAIMMHKQAGRAITYNYNRTEPGGDDCVWSGDEHNYNVNGNFYFKNGCWYNVTQRIVLNTFTGTVANYDGINEVWVDGTMIYQETGQRLIEDSSLKVDILGLLSFYGGSDVTYMPTHESNTLIDNIRIYNYKNHDITGNTPHLTSEILETPDVITDRAVYYDSLRTTTGTLRNANYPNSDDCLDETYLIDAGTGKTVSFEVQGGSIGAGDYLFFYDGNQTDSPLINVFIGSTPLSVVTLNSTGRYMFVRFSTNQDYGSGNWIGSITFN